MDKPEGPPRAQLVLQALAGIALIVIGATAFLWLVFDDHLVARTATPSPTGLTVWAVVRGGAAVALAAGTWLLALSLVNRRRHRER